MNVFRINKEIVISTIYAQSFSTITCQNNLGMQWSAQACTEVMVLKWVLYIFSRCSIYFSSEHRCMEIETLRKRKASS